MDNGHHESLRGIEVYEAPDPDAYAYTLTLPQDAAGRWGWFESRGYLPEMPGTPLVSDADTLTLGLTEPEAWDFQTAAEELGEAFLTCAGEILAGPVLQLLDEII